VAFYRGLDCALTGTYYNDSLFQLTYFTAALALVFKYVESDLISIWQTVD